MRTLPDMQHADEIHITSQLIYARPEHADEICSSLDKMKGLDIQHMDEDGKIIVVIETASLTNATDMIDTIEALPGVINSWLVYHHCEDAAAMDEIIEQEDGLDHLSPANPVVSN